MLMFHLHLNAELLVKTDLVVISNVFCALWSHHIHGNPSIRFFLESGEESSDKLALREMCQLPVCSIYCLLPVLKAEQEFHLLAEGRQKPRETNNDLVNNLQCSRVVLTIFIVLCLGQNKRHLVIMQYKFVTKRGLSLYSSIWRKCWNVLK